MLSLPEATVTPLELGPGTLLAGRGIIMSHSSPALIRVRATPAVPGRRPPMPVATESDRDDRVCRTVTDSEPEPESLALGRANLND